MGRRFYHAATYFGRFVHRQCIKDVILHRERGVRDGGYLLACTHISHTEPLLISNITPRMVHWMARKEFFKYRWGAALLRWVNSFSVDRQGIPVRAIRHAIDLAKAGECVGIFPEGGVKKKHEAVFRGGKMKLGVCVIAHRAQVPVVPVVILGTHKLNCIDPWLPGLHAKLWVAFGEPIFPPPPTLHRRTARFEMGKQIQCGLMKTYQELLEHSGLRDGEIP